MTWLSEYVAVGDLRLHYTRTGGPGPVVVMAHGITDNGLCWSRVARRLEATHDVIMYDARGHGLSDAPADGYSYDDHSRDLAGFIAALDLDRPVVLGHSMGAGTALLAAAHYPDRVGAIILEDPALRTGELLTPEAIADHVQMYADHISGYAAPTREELLAGVRQRCPAWSEEELAPWADAKKQVKPQVVGLIRSGAPDWQAALPAISCPILLITADPELGSIVTPEVAAQAADMWQCGQVVHIPGAGHSIHRDQFEPYMAAVATFLRCI
jgi:N-formylmaleamate deformylase